MRWVRPFLVHALGLLTACQEAKRSTAPETVSVPVTSAFDSTPILRLGDSLTTERQQVLLQRLLAASEKEGWGGAVRYCHAVAETLAFYQRGDLYLQRIAERYRNPKDKLQDSLDEAAFRHYQETKAKTPLVWQVEEGWRYYRPIYIIMPTCLKCHGQKEALDAKALTEIRKLYPGDKATDFQMGDLRGLWRIAKP